MLLQATQELLDKIDELDRNCAYTGKYVQRVVNGLEVDDLYFDDGVLMHYCSHNDTQTKVELDEDDMFDLEVHLVSYKDITDQLFGG